MQSRNLMSFMTPFPKTVRPETRASEVAYLFNTESFHHIPVVDDLDKPIGMISKTDYHQLEHHFTKQGLPQAIDHNKRLFDALIARDIMSKHVACLEYDQDIMSVIDIFLVNRIHSVVVVKEGVCIGIVTPYDVLAVVREELAPINSSK